MSSITLSFGRRWGGYRTAWLNQFNFTLPSLQRVSLHVSMSVCRARAGTRALSEWHSDTSTAGDGQRADSQAAGPDSGMLLRSRSHPTGMHRWGWLTSLLEPFCAVKVLCIARLNETAVSLDYWRTASNHLCLSIAWIFNTCHWIMLTLAWLLLWPFLALYHIFSLSEKTRLYWTLCITLDENIQCPHPQIGQHLKV